MHAAPRHARMITIVQRVLHARVHVDGEEVGACARGFLLLVGVERGDSDPDADATAEKLRKLRCFPGRTPMDATIADIGGSVLVVSQFTLFASTRKGTRPSFNAAAKPDLAIPLYETFCRLLSVALGRPVATGQFGAQMAVSLVNDGPVTLIIDTRLRE